MHCRAPPISDVGQTRVVVQAPAWLKPSHGHGCCTAPVCTAAACSSVAASTAAAAAARAGIPCPGSHQASSFCRCRVAVRGGPGAVVLRALPCYWRPSAWPTTGGWQPSQPTACGAGTTQVGSAPGRSSVGTGNDSRRASGSCRCTGAIGCGVARDRWRLRSPVARPLQAWWQGCTGRCRGDVGACNRSLRGAVAEAAGGARDAAHGAGARPRHAERPGLRQAARKGRRGRRGPGRGRGHHGRGLPAQPRQAALQRVPRHARAARARQGGTEALGGCRGGLRAGNIALAPTAGQT
mmetsp:Transcript_18831/g.59073  ORF Transcript_18831/g.59073 Transcript_18831/m.59073 type:complete len:295 (-) Transcript_18831:188-1072(-)